MRTHFLLFILLTISGTLCAQESSQEDIYGRIFSNFHHSIEGPKETGFEVQRAYLGYDHSIDNRFSAHIKLDIGSPDNKSVYALLKRYAYFKNAYLQYQHKKLRIRFGLVDNFMFKIQEKVWGHKYIYDSFMDEHDFGTSADLGTTISYTFSSKVSADLGIINGEGYNSLQSDNNFLTEAALTYKPHEMITLRGFYSMMEKEVAEHTFAVFGGVKTSNGVTAGAELNYKKNMALISGNNAVGYSFYGSYDVDKEWQVFGRYDKLTSNIPVGDEKPWNLVNDGSAVIAGVQYKPVPEIAMAINYQDWVPWASNLTTDSYLYFNLLYTL